MFEFDLGIFAALTLLLAAAVVAIIGQLLGEPFGWGEFTATFVAAAVGGFLFSEWLPLGEGFGPVWDGLYLLPAIVGVALVGFVVAFAYRLVAGRLDVGHARG